MIEMNEQVQERGITEVGGYQFVLQLRRIYGCECGMMMSSILHSRSIVLEE